MLFDEISDVHVSTCLAPASRTASTAQGTAVSQGAYQQMTVVFSTGALGGGTATPTIEESANGSTGWAEIAADRLNGTLAAISANSTLVIGLTDIAGVTKQYVRPVITVAGGSGTLCSAYIIRKFPRHAPVGSASTIIVG